MDRNNQNRYLDEAEIHRVFFQSHDIRVTKIRAGRLSAGHGLDVGTTVNGKSAENIR